MALYPLIQPGMDPVAICVVTPKTQVDASTYDLVHGGVRPTRESGDANEIASEASPASPWERSDMTRKDWLSLFKALEKRKERLGAPPRENSPDRESYIGLRDLLFTDSVVRRAFLAVHWKRRPSGFALPCQLPSAGTPGPGVATGPGLPPGGARRL